LSVEERPIPFTEITTANQNGTPVEAFGIGTAATIAPIKKSALTEPYFRHPLNPTQHVPVKTMPEDIRPGSPPIAALEPYYRTIKAIIIVVWFS
jgi:hypothetical protein